MKKSAVIIGGGLGGLFTGAILAKEGVGVTVIEKNPTIGGGLQSFTRFGEVFDTGMHVVAGMQEGGSIRRLCEWLGIFDKIHVSNVDPEQIDELYFSEDRRTYRISQGREGFVKTLAEQFPGQEDNLRRYVDAMFSIVSELDLFHLRPSTSFIPMHSEEFTMPADAFVAKYIDDERLASVVSYMNPLYAGRKDMTPAYIHAVVSVLYINGPSRFAGGTQLFADTLGEFIAAHGGLIVKGDGVAKVCTCDNRISSVLTSKGREFSADYYICAIHPVSFIELLDDPKVLPKPYRMRLAQIPNSYSAFTLNIKLKPKTFKYINHTSYYMSRYADIWSFGDESKVWPLGFLYMTPPELEQGEWAGKMIITAPMTWSHVLPWEDTKVGHRGKDYESWKAECSEKLLDLMEEMFPGFRSCVEAVNTASPLTIRDWYGVKEGSMCGFSKDSGNLILTQVPVVTKVDNLLLTGQHVNLHGFCGVPLTAINTSEVILGHNYILNKLNEA